MPTHLTLISLSTGPISFFFFFFLFLPVYCYQPISLHPHAHMLSHVIPWTSARQTPLSMDFSRQEYWSGLPFPSPRVHILKVFLALETNTGPRALNTLFLGHLNVRYKMRISHGRMPKSVKERLHSHGVCHTGNTLYILNE